MPAGNPTSSLPPGFITAILRAHELICETEDEDKPHPGILGGDPGRLEQIVARVDEVPYGREAFPSIQEKAAILLQELIDIHPFVDGNKRTALVATAYFLLWHGRPLVNTMTEAEIVKRIADKAGAPPSFQEIVRWIDANSQPFDVARQANTARFARYSELEFQFDLTKHDQADRSRVAIDVHAVNPRTMKKVGGGPFLRRVLDFLRGPRPAAEQPTNELAPPAPTPEEIMVRRRRHQQNLQKRRRTKKRKRRKKRR